MSGLNSCATQSSTNQAEIIVHAIHLKRKTAKSLKTFK